MSATVFQMLFLDRCSECFWVLNLAQWLYQSFIVMKFSSSLVEMQDWLYCHSNLNKSGYDTNIILIFLIHKHIPQPDKTKQADNICLQNSFED